LTTLSALGFARFGYSLILPSMQRGLGFTNTDTGMLASGNFIGYLFMALVGGFLASHYGPRRVIAVSLLLVGVAMVMTGFSYNFASAFVFRVLTGLGSGGSNVPVMGLMAAWFATKRRGLATGVAVSGSSFALIITGSLVPFILNSSPTNGWRYSWFVLGAFIIPIAVLAYFLLRDRPQEKNLAPIGTETKPAGNGQPGQKTQDDAPRGIKSWALVYKSGVVWHLSLIYFMFGFSYIIYLTYFAKYLQDELHFTKEAAGHYWQLLGWTSLLCGVIWGGISDVIGRKYALALVSIQQACAYLIFAVWTTAPGPAVSAVVFGLSAWSIPAIMASACGDHLGARLAPSALGFMTLIFGIGQMLGPPTAGWIADHTGSFVLAFIAAMAAALIGAVTSFFLKRAQ
jgi:sugar phosphate permease